MHEQKYILSLGFSTPWNSFFELEVFICNYMNIKLRIKCPKVVHLEIPDVKLMSFI